MSTPSSVILKILAGLGGAASGAGGALQDITVNRQHQQQIDINRQQEEENASNNRQAREIQRKQADAEAIHQAAMLSEQQSQTLTAQRQLDAQIASAKTAGERMQLEDARKKLEDFQNNLRLGGITSLNPRQAMNAYGEQGLTPEATAELGGLINKTGAGMGNEARRYIPGTEKYGGFVYEGHPFNPSQGGSYSEDAIKFRQKQAFATMLNQTRTQIQNAYKAAYNTFTSNPAIAGIIKDYGSPDKMAAARRQADTEARAQIQDSAQAMLNALFQAFPEESSGLTVESLLGLTSTQKAMPQGFASPLQQGNNINLPPNPGGGRGAVARPQGAVDPNDPFGIHQGGPPGPQPPAARAPLPAPRPGGFNDFLNLGSRRP